MTHKENTSGECKAQLVTKWAPVSSPALLFSSSLLPCRAVLIPPCFCFQYFPLPYSILLHKYCSFRVQLKPSPSQWKIAWYTPLPSCRTDPSQLCVPTYRLISWPPATALPSHICFLPLSGKGWKTGPQHLFPLFPDPVLGTQVGTELSAEGINKWIIVIHVLLFSSASIAWKFLQLFVCLTTTISKMVFAPRRWLVRI